MKKTMLFAIFALIIFTACTVKPPVIDTAEADVSSLISAKAEIETLDTAYKTNWHEESIPNNPANEEYAREYARAIQPMIDKANATGSWQAYQFLSARQIMLETEADYQKAQKLDPRPLAEVTQVGLQTIINASLDDFDCNNAEEIKQATILYSDILKKGHSATYTLDNLMQYDVSAREIIGVKTLDNDKRPRYYLSAFGRVLNTIKINALLLERMCKMPVGNLYKGTGTQVLNGN